MKFAHLWLPSIFAVCSAVPACGGAPDRTNIDVRAELTTSSSYASALAFDWGDYLSRYSDLGVAGIDTQPQALNHWKEHGIEEGRQGAPHLSPKDYLDSNADLAAAFTDPRTRYAQALDHFVAHGLDEKRVGAPFDRLIFDWRYYVGHNSDLASFNEGQARYHWAMYGMTEGRRASSAFYVRDYIDLNPDVPRDFKASIQHWQIFGAREGRRGARDVPNAKRIGMLYSVWHGLAASAQRHQACVSDHNATCGGQTLTVSDVITARARGQDVRLRDVYSSDTLRRHAGNFYYLNHPAGGFYSLYRKRPSEPPIDYFGLPVLDSLDTKTPARRHARQLVAANVDFVYVDLSNLPSRGIEADVLQLRPLEVLFEEWRAMRAEGERTPEIAVFAPAPAPAVLKPGQVPPVPVWPDYLQLYNRPEYADLIARDAYTNKKLFFVTDQPGNPMTGEVEQKYDADVAAAIASNGGRNDVLTVRTGWPGIGLDTTSKGVAQWSSPCNVNSVAGFATSSIGRDTPCNQPYTALPPAGGGIMTTASFVNSSAAYVTNGSSRFGGSSGANGGLTLKKTFERGLALHPDFLLLTQWNEHIAQPQPFEFGAAPIDPEVFAMGLEGDVREPSDDAKIVPDGRSYFVDQYAFDYTRDIEPAEENQGNTYDVLRSCMRVYRIGGLGNACVNSSERCCQFGENDHFTNVYSLRKKDSASDYLVTKFVEEKARLLGSGAWIEILNRYAGSSDFPQGTSAEDKYSGPFVLDASPGARRSPLYRCRGATDHFLSLSEACERERQASDGLVGYVATAPEGAYLRPLLRCIKGQTHLHALAAACPSGSMLEQRLGFVR